MSGLSKTFQILAESKNEAAVGLLMTTLGSTDASLRRYAFEALLECRHSDGFRELLARWHTFEDDWKALIAERAKRIEGALRSAILSTDLQLHRNACDAVVYLSDYDLIPTLIRAAEDKGNPHAQVAGRAIVYLAERLYQEINSPRDYSKRRDPMLLRQYIHSALANALERFDQHRRIELIDAYLILAQHDDPIVTHALRDADAVLHSPISQLLSASHRLSEVNLILRILENPQAPGCVLSIVSRRRDTPFLWPLLSKAAEEMRPAMRANLRKIENFSWLRDDLRPLLDFTDDHLAGVVRLAVQSGVNRLKAYEVVTYVLAHGGTVSRRVASAALAEFKGTTANELCLKTLDDPDPEVKANAVGQLRERGIPGALPRLLELIENPQPCVQQAAQRALSEFNFQRYLSAFEMLDPEVRRCSGGLVIRVDSQALEQLEAELISPSRNRRLRGIEVAVAMGVVGRVESSLVLLASDPDHFIRAEAARALVHAKSEKARQILVELTQDRSVSVQEAAREALVRIDCELSTSPTDVPPTLPALDVPMISDNNVAEATR